MTDDFRMPSFESLSTITTLATLFDSRSLTLEHLLLREHETKLLPIHARAAHVLQILVTAAKTPSDYDDFTMNNDDLIELRNELSVFVRALFSPKREIASITRPSSDEKILNHIHLVHANDDPWKMFTWAFHCGSYPEDKHLSYLWGGWSQIIDFVLKVMELESEQKSDSCTGTLLKLLGLHPNVSKAVLSIFVNRRCRSGGKPIAVSPVYKDELEGVPPSDVWYSGSTIPYQKRLVYLLYKQLIASKRSYVVSSFCSLVVSYLIEMDIQDFSLFMIEEHYEPENCMVSLAVATILTLVRDQKPIAVMLKPLISENNKLDILNSILLLEEQLDTLLSAVPISAMTADGDVKMFEPPNEVELLPDNLIVQISAPGTYFDYFLKIKISLYYLLVVWKRNSTVSVDLEKRVLDKLRSSEHKQLLDMQTLTKKYLDSALKAEAPKFYELLTDFFSAEDQFFMSADFEEAPSYEQLL